MKIFFPPLPFFFLIENGRSSPQRPWEINAFSGWMANGTRENVPLASIIGARKPMIHVAFALPLLFKSMERNKCPLDGRQKKISVRPDGYTLSNVRWSLSVSRHNYRSGSPFRCSPVNFGIFDIISLGRDIRCSESEGILFVRGFYEGTRRGKESKGWRRRDI